MGRPYIKLDLDIAKLEQEGKELEACFGRYIAFKENLQRLNEKNPLPKGQLYLTARSVYEDLKLSSTREANRLINLFEDYGVIKVVFKSNSKKQPSVYSYVVAETVFETDGEMDSETDKFNKNKDLDNKTETVFETDNETNFETSKKEILKRNIKKDISHSNNDQLEDKYLEIFNHWNKEHTKKGISKAVKLAVDIKKGIDAALKIRKEDDTNMTTEDIKKSISNYAEVYKLHLFTYQWRLVDFLKRKQKDTGIPQLLLFLDNGTTYVNCKSRLNNNTSNNSNFLNEKAQKAYASIDHLKGGIEFE